MAGTVRPVMTRKSVHVQKSVAKTQPTPPIISQVKHAKNDPFRPTLKYYAKYSRKNRTESSSCLEKSRKLVRKTAVSSDKPDRKVYKHIIKVKIK
jgi:hypothetical protein